MPRADDPATDPHAVDRELDVLGRALDQANAIRQNRAQPLYVLWHYPPFDANGQPGPWVGLWERAGVTACVYGHLHIESQWATAVQGLVGGVRYYCVAADAIGFRPLRISAMPPG